MSSENPAVVYNRSMAAKKKTLVPQQARSRESLKRLMKATVEVLEQKGLAGATIPRIATRAGLSPGSVYRRFPDKDALLRGVMLMMWEQIDQQTAKFFTPEVGAHGSLRFFVEQTIANSLMSY